VEVFRTPDERFSDLPGYDFAPNYVEVDGLRLHYLDEGEGDPIVCFHGEPTWSYLYRKMIPPLVEGGHRVIAPDYAGFGRSDKPTDREWYTYDRHTELMRALLEQVGVQGATVVVQDWGGPIGLRWATEDEDRVDRLVIMNTGVFTGHVNEAFMAWRSFAERNPDLWDVFNIPVTDTNALAADELEEMQRTMTPHQFEREMMCSFEAPVENSYYGDLMVAAKMDGRLTRVPYDPRAKVITAWDLGMKDLTTIWFAQKIGQENLLPSLQLAVEDPNSSSSNCGEGYSCSYTNSLSWPTATSPLPMELDPQVVFERLFGSGATPEVRSARMQQSRSILDSLLAELQSLKKSLGASDQKTVNQYTDEVREIEAPLEGAVRNTLMEIFLIAILRLASADQQQVLLRGDR